jgi:hypothetical protein
VLPNAGAFGCKSVTVNRIRCGFAFLFFEAGDGTLRRVGAKLEAPAASKTTRM